MSVLGESHVSGQDVPCGKLLQMTFFFGSDSGLAVCLVMRACAAQTRSVCCWLGAGLEASWWWTSRILPPAVQTGPHFPASPLGPSVEAGLTAAAARPHLPPQPTQLRLGA